MNRTYTLHDDSAKRLYASAMAVSNELADAGLTGEAAEVAAVAGTLRAQNPELRK